MHCAPSIESRDNTHTTLVAFSFQLSAVSCQPSAFSERFPLSVKSRELRADNLSIGKIYGTWNALKTNVNPVVKPIVGSMVVRPKNSPASRRIDARV